MTSLLILRYDKFLYIDEVIAEYYGAKTQSIFKRNQKVLYVILLHMHLCKRILACL